MSGQDSLCANCARFNSSRFCRCGGRETFLCEVCIKIHIEQHPLEVHETVPISLHGQHKNQGYFERLQDRLSNFEVTRSELLENARSIDDCIEQVKQIFEEIINAARIRETEMVSLLLSVKEGMERDIKEAIKEVNETMYEDSPVLHTQLAKYIRGYNKELGPVKYFTYKIDSTKAISALKSLCEFSVSAPEYLLPGIIKNTFLIYNVGSLERSHFSLKKSFEPGFRLCFIKERTILAVGSTTATTNAYVISFPIIQIAETQRMQKPHKLPGLIAVGEFAYVFGGQCIECEKLDIQTMQWIPLANLQKEPAALSPVLNEKKIYLINIRSPIEVFNIDSQIFEQITVNPNGLNSGMSCFWVSGEIITISSNRQIGRWRIGEESIRIGTFEQQGDSTLSQCPPQLIGRNLYFVSFQQATLNCFDLDSCINRRKL